MTEGFMGREEIVLEWTGDRALREQAKQYFGSVPDSRYVVRFSSLEKIYQLEGGPKCNISLAAKSLAEDLKVENLHLEDFDSLVDCLRGREDMKGQEREDKKNIEITLIWRPA